MPKPTLTKPYIAQINTLLAISRAMPTVMQSEAKDGY